MSVRQDIEGQRDEILRVIARHGAGNALLFGSVARGDENAQSDVDLLVDITGETTPWFPGSLVADLEQLLERPGSSTARSGSLVKSQRAYISHVLECLTPKTQVTRAEAAGAARALR